MAKKRLPLTALRTFEAAARHLSFKNAAEELSVSATTVSNQIRQLEKDWDCKLFHRLTRTVVLTEAGASLSAVLTRTFGEIRAEIETNFVVPRRSVTVAVGPIFGSRWLSPKLSQFSRDHPEIELVVTHGTRIERSEDMSSDIGIDWGLGDWSGLEATKLLDIRYSPIISSQLLCQVGGISKPSDVAKLPIIHQHDRTEWRNWFKLAGCPDIRPSSEVVIVDSNMVLRAVKDSQGLALGVFPFMDDEVRSGSLVKPIDLELHPSRSFYLLTRPGARENPDIRAVCEWIEAKVA